MGAERETRLRAKLASADDLLSSGRAATDSMVLLSRSSANGFCERPPTSICRMASMVGIDRTFALPCRGVFRAGFSSEFRGEALCQPLLRYEERRGEVVGEVLGEALGDAPGDV